MHKADMFAERPFSYLIYLNTLVFSQAVAYPTRLDNAVRVKRPRKRKVSFHLVFPPHHQPSCDFSYVRCLNPSTWRHLNPFSYWAVGWFSAGYLNFELNCATFYSKWRSFVINCWISLKLEARFLQVSNLFESVMKSCFKCVAWCGMSWYILQCKVQPDIQGIKTLSPSLCCVYNTLHTTSLDWPSCLLVGFFQGNVFQEVVAHFCQWNDGLPLSFQFLSHVQ
jgi:hypothetical protein